MDAANVIGSRPHGWWRDRAGAARRLYDVLAAAHLDTDVVLILEGAARAGVSPISSGSVRVVHAAGVGDDEVVTHTRTARDAGLEVTVVTSDRELRARVSRLGAQVRGAGAFRRELDES